jgi:hypothetical protein
MRIKRATTSIHLLFVSISIAITSIVLPSPVSANPITYNLPGKLTVVDDPNGVLAANNPGIAIGSSFTILFTFDDSLAPTFPNVYGPEGGVTSWWGAGHSSMSLNIGTSLWQTIGPERVDAVYDNPPPAIGLPQAISADHWTDAISTNVTPVFSPVGGVYHLNWSVNNTSGFYEPMLTPDNFPASIDLTHWEFGRMFLDVSQTGANGELNSYYVEGRFADLRAASVPEPSSLSVIGAVMLLLCAASTRSRTITGYKNSYRAAKSKSQLTF